MTIENVNKLRVCFNIPTENVTKHYGSSIGFFNIAIENVNKHYLFFNIPIKHVNKQHDYSTTTIRLQYDYSATTVQLQYDYSTTTVRLQNDYDGFPILPSKMLMNSMIHQYSNRKRQ